MNKYISFTIGTLVAASAIIAGCGGDTVNQDGLFASDGSAGAMDATINDSGAPDTLVAPADAGDASTCGSLTRCSGACVDTTSDGDNCGGCGNTCASGMVCSSSMCASTCTNGATVCGNDCVATATDPNNCGACGKVCATGLLCSNGQCATTCAAGLTACSAGLSAASDAGTSVATFRCYDTTSDDANCGACGTVCAAGQVCSNGACAVSCQVGFVECGGTCFDPASDPTHCGATTGCGVDAGTAGATCAAGQVCNAGVCATSCQSGLVDCNGSCVDPKTNDAFCGAAGNCTNDHAGTDSAGTVCAAGTICSGNGTCQANCQADEILCGTTCVNPLVNPIFCGAKGSCANDGHGTDTAGATCAAGQVCTNGSCQATCATGQVVCSNACVDPQTDPSHCGATAGCMGGAVCSGGQVCNHGACATTCQPDEVLCGSTCVNPLTNPGFCGAAGQCNAANGPNTRGTACATGDVCANGICAVSCPSNTVNCGGTCVDPKTNSTFCGAAGNCTNDHAGVDTAGATCASGTVCASGACTTNCGAGLSICTNACVDEQHDPAHCGGCSACAAEANVTADVCRSGVCAVGTCAAGTADCDGTFSNGCEVSTATSASNCGACGHACASGFVCANSVCVGPKTVFITSAVYGSSLGGLAGADALCQASASAAGLAGTYKAWLSDDQGTPDTRFTQSPTPYKRVDGVIVANNFTSLTSGSLLAPIDVTETGGAPSASNFCDLNTVKVWTDTSETGALPPGAEGNNCTDWSGAGTALWGLATASDSTWTVYCGGGAVTCADQTMYAAHLYCFQQ